MRQTSKELARLDPLEAMTPFGYTFGRMFDEVFGNSENGVRAIAPALDISEDEHAITVTAELPGLKKEDVQLTVENGVLSINGQKKSEIEAKDRHWHRIERRFGSFHRTVSMPPGVVTDKAQAKFEDGVLTVTLPKTDEVKPKTLKIS